LSIVKWKWKLNDQKNLLKLHSINGLFLPIEIFITYLHSYKMNSEKIVKDEKNQAKNSSWCYQHILQTRINYSVKTLMPENAWKLHSISN